MSQQAARQALKLQICKQHKPCCQGASEHAERAATYAITSTESLEGSSVSSASETDHASLLEVAAIAVV